MLFKKVNLIDFLKSVLLNYTFISYFNLICDFPEPLFFLIYNLINCFCKYCNPVWICQCYYRIWSNSRYKRKKTCIHDIVHARSYLHLVIVLHCEVYMIIYVYIRIRIFFDSPVDVLNKVRKRRIKKKEEIQN